MLSNRICLKCALVIGLIAAMTPELRGEVGLVFYTNQAEFEQANADAGNLHKGVEDFEESILPPQDSGVIDDPLEPGVPNFQFLNGLEGLDNILVQSNTLGGAPDDPAPLGIFGMRTRSVGSGGVSSDIIMASLSSSSLDIIVTDPNTVSVGLNPLAILGGNEVEVRVYDTANNLLGLITVPADAAGSFFTGVISQIPIGRINIWNLGLNSGCDNIQKWVSCPQNPASFIENVTQGTFHCSIQDAIDTADNGDEIVVPEGTYFENINFLSLAIKLSSTDPTDPAVIAATIIDGGGVGSVVTCNSAEGPDTILVGFTITGGSATLGGGMLNDGSSPTVANCIFTGNEAGSLGGGMGNGSSGSATVVNCLFTGNTATFGGGMANFSSSTPSIINCTFSGNDAFEGGAMSFTTSTSAILTNCVLWGDTPNEIFLTGSTPTITFSNVQGGFAGEGNINEDPLYVDAGSGDYRLLSDSPCIDAGNIGALPLDEADLDGDGITAEPIPLDLDGLPRAVCPGNLDMGAYEFQDPPMQVENFTQGIFYCTIQEAINDSINGDEIVVPEGTYFENINFNGMAITLRSTDPMDPAVVAATIIDGGGAGSVVTCVSAEGSDTVLSGFTITGGVAANGGGMHNVGSSPTVTNCSFIGNMANRGGGMRNLNGSSPTVSNCAFVGNMANSRGGGMNNFSSSNPTVTNCLFISNTANSNGGGMINDACSSPMVTNCTFVANTASFGGGMNNDENCNPTVTNCSFIGNMANNAGGGMNNFDSSSPTVTNCTFVANTASFGGGMGNDQSSPTVTNSTFVANTASFGGGMGNDQSSPTVTNCILWGNSPDEIFNTVSTPTVTYCNVQGGYKGEGNIDADPMFVDPDGPDDIPGNEDDDLRLLADSPCIDAADNTAPGLIGITEDLDGNPRFIEDPKTPDTGLGDCPIVDIGSYEFQEGTPDCCPWDLDGSGSVGTSDLLALFAQWGTDGPADFDESGTVDTADLLILFANWGPCP